jgi:hypothetical protein
MDSPSDQSSFELLVRDVKCKLDDYLKTIELEVFKIQGRKIDKEVFLDWYKFHSELNMIPVPKDVLEQIRYLKKIHGIAPPIVCYTS